MHHGVTRIEPERRNPKILNGSRRARIARGAGVTVSEVSNVVVRFLEGQKTMRQMLGGGGIPGMPQIPGMRRATKKAAKGRKASAKKKPKGGRPGAPARSGGGSGSPAGAVPDGLRGAGKDSTESARGGLAGGLPAGLRKPGANDDLAAGLEALAKGNPGFLVLPEDDDKQGSGPAPTDLPAGFGRLRRGKQGDR